MNQDKLIELAKQTNVSIRGHYDETGSTPAELQRFAELGRDEALEEAAKLCDVFGTPESPLLAQNDEQWGASMCAARIRSLK